MLRDLKCCGLRASVLAVRDGPLGFWREVRNVWHETGKQRCWVHRLARVLDKLPKRLQAKAKRELHESPSEHWQHLRTTNAIESSFATVRLRQRVTKGAGSRPKAMFMAFKLVDMAQKRWRRVTSPHLVPLVRQRVTFTNGTQVRNAA